MTIDPGMTIGCFSQDVGEMSGKSAVAAVMDGVGPVSALATAMAGLEAAMADPVLAGDGGDRMDALVERYGRVRGHIETLAMTPFIDYDVYNRCLYWILTSQSGKLY